MLRPDLRSGCRCAKARPKVWLWFSSGLAVVCAGMLSVIYAGVLIVICAGVLSVIQAGVPSVICAGVLLPD